MMRRLAGLSALALLLCCLAPAAAQDKKPRPGADDSKLLDLVNKARADGGLTPLKPSAALSKAARAHAEAMARGEAKVEDRDARLTAALKKAAEAAGYPARAVGAALAKTDGLVGPGELLDVWMKAEVSKSQILNKTYTDAGVGVLRTPKGDVYYVLMLGTARR